MVLWQCVHFFNSRVTLAAKGMRTASMSVGTHSLLERTAAAFAPPGEGRVCSKYARQPAAKSPGHARKRAGDLPATATEGLTQAYSALARGLRMACRSLGTIPELAPRSSYLTAGLQAVPVAPSACL